jgi:hypothetical protein
VALGNTKYHHQESYIPNAGFMLVFLDHGSRTNERDRTIFYNLSREFAHELHYFEVGHLPRRGVIRNERASTKNWHSKHMIHIGSLGSWLKDK